MMPIECGGGGGGGRVLVVAVHGDHGRGGAWSSTYWGWSWWWYFGHAMVTLVAVCGGRNGIHGDGSGGGHIVLINEKIYSTLTHYVRVD